MTTTTPVTLRAAGATDAGRVRANNEDAWCAEEGVFIVADGMGGHQGGEVASAVAIDTVRQGRPEVTDREGLMALIAQANAAIVTRAEAEPENRGMGTTLTGLMIIGDPDDEQPQVALVNVGDSRTYQWRNGVLVQLTTDHSYVQDLVTSGVLTVEEARHHPRRNIVTRALGVEQAVSPDVTDLAVAVGDRYLVCSDGLVDEVDDQTIADILAASPDPADAVQRLVQRALDHGGRDNVTVVVVDVIRSGSNGDSDLVTVSPHESSAATVASTPPPDAPRRRRRRALLVTSVITGVALTIATVVASVGIYARAGYFVDFDTDDQVVAVYRGRPGGVWWFRPTLVEVTDLRRDDLAPLDIERVDTQPVFVTLDDANEYLTTVTTTTTTVPR